MNNTVLKRNWISLLLLTIGFILIYNPWTKFPYTFCVIILFVIAATYFQDKTLQNLNFKKVGLREIKIIIISFLLLELSADFIFQPVVNRLFNEPSDYSSFKHIEGNTKLYISFLWKMWISAAVGEELLFRAFVFSQMNRIIQNKKSVVVLFSAILFCIPHLYQGLSGLVMTFIFGIIFALLYNRYQNIWINIIVHGLIDSVFLTLSYLGLLDFYNLVW